MRRDERDGVARVTIESEVEVEAEEGEGDAGRREGQEKGRGKVGAQREGRQAREVEEEPGWYRRLSEAGSGEVEREGYEGGREVGNEGVQGGEAEVGRGAVSSSDSSGACHGSAPRRRSSSITPAPLRRRWRRQGREPSATPKSRVLPLASSVVMLSDVSWCPGRNSKALGVYVCIPSVTMRSEGRSSCSVGCCSGWRSSTCSTAEHMRTARAANSPRAPSTPRVRCSTGLCPR